VSSAKEIIDGMGNIHAQVYASVGVLPPVRAGALVIVDDGTSATLYFGAHDNTSSLVWVALNQLWNAIVQFPTPGQNVITDLSTTDIALVVASDFEGIEITAPGKSLQAIQTGSVPTTPVVRYSRLSETDGVPLEIFRPDGSTDVATVNGAAEITARPYDTLPSPTTGHLGGIVRLLGGSGHEDTFWMCVLNGIDVPIWTQFIGPSGTDGTDGTNGTNGTNGVTPLFQVAGGYLQVSYDEGTTWANLIALSAITGPQGMIDFPALPAPGADPITFQMMVYGRGTMMPYLFPVGYGIQVVATTGFFVIHDPMQDYITSGPGSAVDNEANGFAIGRLLARFAQTDAGGLPTGTQPADLTTGYDAFTVLTVEIADTVVELYANSAVPGTQDSYVLATITISPVAPVSSPQVINFLPSDGGFTYTSIYATGIWISGQGLRPTVDGAAQYVYKDFINAAAITRMVWKFYSVDGFPSGFGAYINAGPGTPVTFRTAVLQSDPHYCILDESEAWSVTPTGGSNIGIYLPASFPASYLIELDIYFTSSAYPV
jgi:hypothetical protein